MKVLFTTNIPSPYRVDFFNELGKHCDLTVLYERKSSTERDALWKNKEERTFKEIFCNLKEVGVDKSSGSDLIKKIKSLTFDHLIISGYSSYSVMKLISYCKRKKIPYNIEVDGGFNKKENFLKRLIKKSLIIKAKSIFLTCDELIAYYKNLGYEGKLYKYPFTSLKECDISPTILSNEQKLELRKKLNIPEEKVVITVGRFSYLNGYGKGYDVILKSANILKDKNIGWYIVGGKPTEEFIKLKEENNLTNVHYVDFKEKEELKKYYQASDLFVLMTVSDVWGLVINEAMANALPIITTDKCIAGLEIINNGENGYILPVGDYQGLSDKVSEILSNDELKEKMQKNNIQKIKYYTIENMAKYHIDVLSSKE